uniref:Reverse transcriptase/retrotransposon-derived protein RNase H-like domain-containing protein n=1 Tax=Peronospora matthiolae TaxID=2874970 RepID=A0AAV1TF02_9STRA
MDGKTDVEVHRIHIRKVFTLMREHKLFANLKKCIYALNEIPLLGCIVGKTGVRPDPEKIKTIGDWPVPFDVKGLQKFLDLEAYLHKYSRNYAEMTKVLIKSPVLAIADQERPFHVVCDASDFAIGCALAQYDADGAERVAFLPVASAASSCT